LKKLVRRTPCPVMAVQTACHDQPRLPGPMGVDQVADLLGDDHWEVATNRS
jgi:hypothetical protein